AATASYVHFTVFRMDISLHGKASVKCAIIAWRQKIDRAVYLATTALARLSDEVSVPPAWSWSISFGFHWLTHNAKEKSLAFSH
ncbi:MAG: hypothetical protein O6931_02080, partial [Gammaproteobacteria bacterium]|nr:hypothetical protein [Gammaproteobacteria bacterium]